MGNLEMNNEVELVGDELQRISVMRNLPLLIRVDSTATIQRIVPRMQQTLSHGTTEYNMGACEAVRDVAEQHILTPENYTKVFLQHILNSLESRDTVAADEWLNVLLDVIPGLPATVLQNEILPMAVNKARISKPVKVRITSCRILGRLALSFNAFVIKKDVNPIVISLCQDVSGDVRAAMSLELPNISANLGLETGQHLLNHIVELMSDEDTLVRVTTVQALAQMLPRFSQELLKSTIIPLCKKVFSEMMKNEDRALIVLAKYYGQYCIGLKSVMNAQDKLQFFQRYIQMSEMNSNSRRKLNPYKPMVIDEEEVALRFTDVRLQCAYNFPAMAVYAGDLKPDAVETLLTTFRALASDSYCQVRRRIAAGFYEVMKIMPKWHGALKSEFVKLLRDNIDTVLEGLVPNMTNILMSFQASNTLMVDKVESGKDIGQALFTCEKNLSDGLHWRLHEELLLALRSAPRVFHPEFTYTFVPLLMTRAFNLRILPCRVAALHVVLAILADPSQAKQKTKIRNKVLELCNNSSFHCRSLFLRGMSILVQISPEVLKELFFHNITSMADDKVANIRLLLCDLLPKLKALAMDPMDHKLLASVDLCVQTLNKEQDTDVLMRFKAALNQMDDVGTAKLKKSHSVIGTAQKAPQRYATGITPLTDMRSLGGSTASKSTTSQYSVAQQSQQQPRRTSVAATGSRLQSLAVPSTTGEAPRSPSLPRPLTTSKSSTTPSRTGRQSDESKRSSTPSTRRKP